MQRPAGAAALVLVDGVRPLRPEPALFESMLDGWRTQQQSRRLGVSIIANRDRVVRRFQTYTRAWPWAWTPAQVESWVSSEHWAHSTIRAYQGALGMFMAYLIDPRYGWSRVCEDAVGTTPTQICHEWNTAVHVAEYEGRPERRPLTRAELQAFFDGLHHRGLHNRRYRLQEPDAASCLAAGVRSAPGGLPGRRIRPMTAKVGYRWHLRTVMAERGMFATSDLVPLPLSVNMN